MNSEEIKKLQMKRLEGMAQTMLAIYIKCSDMFRGDEQHNRK